MAHAHDSTSTPIKISRSDWKRIPAWLKSHINGVPRVLSRIDGVAEFRPVHIL